MLRTLIYCYKRSRLFSHYLHFVHRSACDWTSSTDLVMGRKIIIIIQSAICNTVQRTDTIVACYALVLIVMDVRRSRTLHELHINEKYAELMLWPFEHECFLWNKKREIWENHRLNRGTQPKRVFIVVGIIPNTNNNNFVYSTNRNGLRLCSLLVIQYSCTL